MSIQIPDGYERTEWANATHALSNGQLLESHWANDGIPKIGGVYMAPLQATKLGLIPLRKLPEIDLSPLTIDEFRRLQIGDTVCRSGETPVIVSEILINAKGVKSVWNDRGLGWEYGPKLWYPTPETARRLGREGKQS
jgi:hypothetical protein